MSYNSFGQHGVGGSAEEGTPKSTSEQILDGAKLHVKGHRTVMTGPFKEVNVTLCESNLKFKK